MSGHNEAQSIFEKVMPERVLGILKEIAAHPAERSSPEGREGPAAVMEAERAFCTSMEGLYAYVGRELGLLDRSISGMPESELETLANRLAGSLKGG